MNWLNLITIRTEKKVKKRLLLVTITHNKSCVFYFKVVGKVSDAMFT